MSKKVYVGMSGGVDSSVTAALLKEQGHDVTGVYMKNWSQDLPGMVCPWKQDYQDAKRVAVQLGIPFKMYDFEKEYRQKVVDYMVAEYKAGRTPNPDIMCNQEVKFRLFLDACVADGADFIATGHYARIVRDSGNSKFQVRSSKQIPNSKVQNPLPVILSEVEGSIKEARTDSSLPLRMTVGESGAQLHVAVNVEKDQTYFLYRVSEEALSRALMPIGEFATKDEVRAKAKEFGLATAEKKDSQGICFVGKVGIKDFLLHELGGQPHGRIIDQNGATVGEHDGAIFYTIGQRHGLQVGGGLPFYVTGKDMAKNEVYVTTDLQDPALWCGEFKLTDLHWINEAPEPDRTYGVRTRYRTPLVECEIKLEDGPIDTASIKLSEEIRAITPGQSAVIYDGDRVVGGGIVA